MENAKAAVGKTLKYYSIIFIFMYLCGFMFALGSVGFCLVGCFLFCCFWFFPSVSGTDISVLLCFFHNCQDIH